MNDLRLAATVLDCPSPRDLAEFYRRLTGWDYAPGHAGVDPAGDRWLVLVNPAGGDLAFAQVDDHRPPTWPDPGDGHPTQVHLDFRVGALEKQVERARGLGARVLVNPLADPDDPVVVLADPAGHPFCLVRG